MFLNAAWSFLRFSACIKEQVSLELLAFLATRTGFKQMGVACIVLPETSTTRTKHTKHTSMQVCSCRHISYPCLGCPWGHRLTVLFPSSSAQPNSCKGRNLPPVSFQRCQFSGPNTSLLSSQGPEKGLLPGSLIQFRSWLWSPTDWWRFDSRVSRVGLIWSPWCQDHKDGPSRRSAVRGVRNLFLRRTHRVQPQILC